MTSAPDMRTVLVTGASGFVGRALCDRLRAARFRVVPALRRADRVPGAVAVGDISAATDWRVALAGCDAVVHLAGRAPMPGTDGPDQRQAYRQINTEAALSLARQAAAAGVRRFVYLSTIKVNGEGRNEPYRETDAPAPETAYARSRWEAEQGLREIGAQTGLEIVVLRPPLVYGPGVKANFRQLMDVVRKGRPLPLAAIDNRRSLLYVGNLVDAIRLCIEHPQAAGRTFLLDDGQPVSTPELVRRLARAMGRPARMLPVPVGLLQLAGALLGKRAAVARLTGSLFVDASLIRSLLGWNPPYSMDDGLAQTVASAR